MEFYYYTEPDSLIHEVRPFMGLKYLEVSLLSEKDQKSNGTNPRIQSRFGKNVPPSKFQKAEEGKDWREKKVVFLLHFISGQLLHILHLSSLAPLQFVLDPGMHEARDWTQSFNNRTLGLISCFTFYSFSHQLLFQWMLLLCFCPTPFPFFLRRSLHFVLENDSPHTSVLKSIIFFCSPYYFDRLMGDHWTWAGQKFSPRIFKVENRKKRLHSHPWSINCHRNGPYIVNN